MALSETGEYVGATVSETGKRRFNSLLENGALVFDAQAVLATVSPTDDQLFSDAFVKLRILALVDSQDAADAVAASTSSALQTVAPSDQHEIRDQFRVVHHRVFPDDFSLTDQATISRPSRNLVLADDFPLSDAVTLEQIAQLRTVTPTDDQHVSDAVFLEQLMRDIRATDAVNFSEQVVVALLTRELRLSDNLRVSDAALVEKFSEEIEAILAGIRTFTCTPGYDLQREAITKTGVADFDQPGLFSVANGAARPSYRFIVNISALTRIQVQSLQSFHFFHQGAKAFYIDGFTAWSAVTTLNLVGEGDGNRKDFFLPNRNIDPDSITVAVYDGVTHSVTTAYSLNAGPGIVAFNTAPSSGHDIEASHGHKYKVVFEPDGLKVDEFAQGVFRAQLKLRELAV